VYSSLSASGRLAVLGVAWTQIAGLLVALLYLGGALPLRDALALGLPIGAAYAWHGVALYYLARAVPLRETGPVQLLATHVAVAILTASLWTAVGRGLVEVMSRVGFPAPPAGVPGPFAPSPAVAYARATPIVLGVGVLLTLLALALHYLILELEATRAAQTQALEAQLHSRDAEVKALRAQLQPHFLYNALNSINSLIGSDPKAARRTCVQLGDLLRRILTLGPKDSIPLSEELELVEALLEIEKVRFGDRLEYRVDVPENARAHAVPPLVLQPLVENAVTHGIAGLLDGGTVEVGGALEDEQLRLWVQNPKDPDSGSRKGTGIGLENVRRRVQALFGRDGTVRVEAGEESFRVEVLLPVATDESSEQIRRSDTT
jgi:two-component system sensor histidine kinase AlgZ